MVQIASVDIGTKLDLSGFYQGLESLSGVKTPVVKFGAKYDTNSIEQEKKRLYKSLNIKTAVKVGADHKELTALNQHIESKRAHVQDVNTWMRSNPIKVKVDSSEVDTILDLIGTKNLVVKTQFTGETPQDTKIFSENLRKSIKQGIADGFKESNKKSFIGQIVSFVTTPITTAVKLTKGTLTNVLEGAAEGLGHTLTKKLGEGFTSGFEKSLNIDQSRIGKTAGEYVGKRGKQNLKAAVNTLGFSGDVTGVVGEKKEPVPPTKTKKSETKTPVEKSETGVAPAVSEKRGSVALPSLIDRFGKPLRSPEKIKEPETQIAPEKVESGGKGTLKFGTPLEGLKKDFRSLGKVIDSFLDPRKLSVKLKKSEDVLVKILEKKSTDNDVSLEDFQKLFKELFVDPNDIRELALRVAGTGLRTAAIPFRIRKRARLAESVDEAKAQSKGIEVPDDIKKGQTISLVTGGINFEKGGLNTYFAENLMKRLTPGAYSVPVTNPWSNDTETLGFLAGMAKKIQGDSYKPQPIDRLLQVAIEKGHNPDSIKMASHAMAYREKYPESPIMLSGTSGGTYVVEEAIAILEKAGLKNIKGLGIAAPLAGLTRTASRKNYQATVGEFDPLYAAMSGGKYLSEAGRASQVWAKTVEELPPIPYLSGLIKPDKSNAVTSFSGTAHAVMLYMANANFQDSMTAHLGKQYLSEPIPKDFRGNAGGANLNFYRLYGQDASNIERTIAATMGDKKAIKEVTQEDKYAFYQPEHLEWRRDGDLGGHITELATIKTRFKDKSLVKFKDDYLKFLTEFQKELTEFYETGKKPVESLKKSLKFFPKLASLANNADAEYSVPILGNPSIARTLAITMGDDDAANEVTQHNKDTFYNPEHPEWRRDNDLGEYIKHFSSITEKFTGENKEFIDEYLRFATEFQKELTEFYETGKMPVESLKKSLKFFPQLTQLATKYAGENTRTLSEVASLVTVKLPEMSEGLPGTSSTIHNQEDKTTEKTGVITALSGKVGATSDALKKAKLAVTSNPEIAKAYLTTIQSVINNLSKEIHTELLSMSPESRMSSTAGNQLANLKSQVSKIVDSTNDLILDLADDAEKYIQELAGLKSADSIKDKYTEQLALAKALETTNPSVAYGLLKELVDNAEKVKAELETMTQSYAKGSPERKKIGSAKGTITKTVKQASAILTNAGTTHKEGEVIGSEVTAGITTGIQQSLSSLQKAAHLLSNELVETTKEDLKIQSPSKIFQWIGEKITEGIVVGIGKTGATVISILGGVWESLKAQGNLIPSIFEGFLAFRGVSHLTQAIATLTPAFLEAGVAMESLERRFLFVSGSAQQASKSLKFVKSEVSRLGTDLKSSLGGYVGLGAATRDTALESQTQKIFSGVSQASTVYDLNSEQQSRVFTAVQQMAGKGKVSAEELRQQLGESLPGAFQIAARAMGVTTQSLDKMMSEGKLLSEDFLPKFAQQLSAETATGVKGAANSSVSALINFNNALFEMQSSVGKLMLPFKNLTLIFGSNTLKTIGENATLLYGIFRALSVFMAVRFVSSLGGMTAALLKIPGVSAVASQALLQFMKVTGLADAKLKATQLVEGLGNTLQNVRANPVQSLKSGASNVLSSAKNFGVAMLDNVKGGLSALNGGLISLQKNGISNIGANFTRGAIGVRAFGKAALINGVAGFIGLASGARALMAAIAPVLTMFVVIEVGMKVFEGISAAFKDASGDSRNFADTATESLQKYREALAESRGETEKFKATKLVRDESLLDAMGIGALLPKEIKTDANWFDKLRFGTGKAVTGLVESPANLLKKLSGGRAGSTYEDKKLGDNINATSALSLGANATTSEALSLLGTKGQGVRELGQLKQHDDQLRQIQTRRAALVAINPQDKAGLKVIDDEQTKILEAREKISKPIGILQSNMQSNIDMLKKEIEKYQKLANEPGRNQAQYKNVLAGLESDLTSAQEAQDKFNRAVGESVNAFSLMQKNIQGVVDKLADAEDSATVTGNTLKSSLYTNSKTQGELQFGLSELDIQQQEAKVKRLLDAQSQAKALLQNKDAQNTLQAYGITENTGRAELKTISEKAGERVNDKYVIDQYSALQERSLEISNLQAGVEQGKYEFNQKLVELNKQITEYYRSASRQFAESSLEAQRQTSQLKVQSWAADIKTSISGFQDNIVSQFADSVIESIQQLSEAADKQFDVGSATLQANNAFEDSLRQGEELRKQLPGISPKGSIGIPAIPIELDLNKIGIDNKFIDITKAFNSGLQEAKDTIKDSESATNNLTSAFQDVTLGSLDFGATIQQAVATTEDGIYATQGLGSELLNTTFTASDLGFAIETNTDSINSNNDAVIATNDSLFASLEATGNVTASTINWGAETSNVGGVIENGLKVALDSLPLSIQEIIKNTVDWFSTFANNIPILNSIGQIFSGWGQQLNNVSQSVASFGQGAMQTVSNVVQQGVGFVQNALGISEKPPVGNASQPVFPIAGVTAAQAESRKTSSWGMRRHPVTGQMKMHRGQDYGYGEGTQVVSPMAGVVTGVRYQAGGAGKYVVVESLDEQGRKIEHKFFHLSAYDVVEGQKLNAGDKIGKVGSTGIGTGAHLHYETWINGKNVNPTEFLAGRNGRGMSSAQKGQIEQHHPGDGHNHGESATQVRQNQSQRQGINASQIASQYGLNSLLVQDVKSGEILGTYNANQSPSSPASTIKLIAADLIHAAIKEGKVSLDQSVTIAKNQVAEGSSIQAGQQVSIRDLMTRMLRDSDNTSFNALIGTLGGTESATAQAQKRGFTGTQIRNYLSIPGATNAYSNTSTPADVTKAMRNLQINQGGAADTARMALGQTRNFGFRGESGGKIGNNSRVTGNVGLANINGRQVIITAYKNQGDSTRNRSQITSASNDVVSQLQGGNTSVSPNIPQRVVNQGGAPRLGKGYEALNELGGQLSQNKYFDPSTPEGRGRLALALGIGGSEAFEKDTNRRSFYTYKGGTGNNMQGFGQFNNAYHKEIINTPEKYQNFFGQILAGERRLPNSQKGIGDYGSKVVEAVQSGRIKDGNDLIRWMQANKLGGSNWQGVDDGWKRNPDLANQLVNYLKGKLPTQQSNTTNNTTNVQIPQVANVPTPTVWTPSSIAARGTAAISDVTNRAEQQRDRQAELARQKASNEAAQNTASALRASNKAFLDLERELRLNGIKVSSLSNQVTDTNLEYKGALDNEQKRQQEQRQLEVKYAELENSIVEQKRAIESQIGTARALLSKGGVVSPEMREKVQKLIDDPTIKENLREQLRTALTTGVLGDDGKNILNRAVVEGEAQLKKLTTGLDNVRKGRGESKKLLDERFAAEEKARKQQAEFDIESASIDTLKAKLDQLQQLKSTAPFSPDVQSIPDLEALISAREEQLNLEKQLKEIQGKEKAKEYTKEEADRLRAEIGERKQILDVTLKQKTETAKLAFLRESEARDREARNELVQAEIANDKVRIEQLKTLAQTNPLSPELANNAIGELEKRVTLREAELQLAQELVTIEQAGIEGKRTPDEITRLRAERQSEYDVKIQNINAQAQQTAFASQISQSKVILSIKEQELQYQKQIADTTAQAINLGLQQGDPIKLKFEVDKKELEISVEKQILDMKEFANSTGKSQEEIAELELKIRELNNLTLGNLKGEFDKALNQRTEAISQRVSVSQVELLDTQASFYSNRGMTNKARTLHRDSAVLQQQSAYRGQKIELEEFIRTTQVGATEADKLRQNLEQVNRVKFDTIKDNFNAFKPVIDTVQTGLKGFFAGIIKGGQSIEELFNGLMDSILGSVAEIASNYLVEKLFDGLLGGNKNEGKGGMFAQGNSETSNPLSLLGNSSELGTTPVLPMYVNVVNGNTFGGLNNDTLGNVFGGKEDSTTSFLSSTFSGFTGKVDSTNPVPVGIIKSAPDALSPITNALGGIFGGKGGFGSIVNGIGGLFSGSGKSVGGLGGILGSVGGLFSGGGGLGGIASIASSLLGSFFWNGGVVGNYAHGGIADAIGREKALNGGRGVAIAALTHGERVLNLAQTQNLDKMGGVDILNFSDGGMVGYVPKTTEYGGSADKVIENASRPKDINVKLETQVINGVEYLTKAQGEDLARKAAQQGAEQGAKYISDRMINSPSYRATHGI